MRDDGWKIFSLQKTSRENIHNSDMKHIDVVSVRSPETEEEKNRYYKWLSNIGGEEMSMIVSKRSLFNRVTYYLNIWGSVRQKRSDFRDLNDTWSVFYETLIAKQRGGLDWTKRHWSYRAGAKNSISFSLIWDLNKCNIRKGAFLCTFLLHFNFVTVNTEVVHVCETEKSEKFCFKLNFNKEFSSLGKLLCSCLCQIGPPTFVFQTPVGAIYGGLLVTKTQIHLKGEEDKHGGPNKYAA